jgi:hypothetical protein
MFCVWRIFGYFRGIREKLFSGLTQVRNQRFLLFVTQYGCISNTAAGIKCVVTDDPGSNPDQKMLGRETGKTTYLGLRVNEFRFVYSILLRCAGVDCEIIAVGFMTAFLRRRYLTSF